MSTPTLANEVVEAMTTNETFFFRDKIPFEHVRDTVMPALIAARAREKRIRIWCTAASTGQEPYSLAMTLMGMNAQLAGFRVDILATDLSGEVLERAKNGIYTPVRGAARAADPAIGEIFHPGRRELADRARAARHGAVSPAQPAQRFQPARRGSTWCSAATC